MQKELIDIDTDKKISTINSVISDVKFIDLFAGIGGFRIPLEGLGAKCVFSSDNDISCQNVYSHNFGDTPYGDITTIAASDIPDFDLLTAGFPCQPFSYAGKLEGFEDKTRGTLFFDVVRILEEKRPRMFLLENVKGIKSHDKGRTLETIISTLSNLGYSTHYKILSSHNFGLPQKRERWYCVGFDKFVDFKFPSSTKTDTKLKDIIDVSNNDPSLRLTKFELDRIKFHFTNAKHKRDRVQHDNSKYAPDTKKGKHGIFSYLKPDNALRFHVGDTAKTQIQEAYYVSLDSVAPTIIATREPKLWDIERRMSLDECKRLQGFPDWFEFNVPKSKALKQLGNAVSVPVVREIVANMIYFYYKDQL